jgi:PAS domain S-box-containing protein
VNEQKFRALFKGIPVPVYTWQRRGNDFVLVNHNDAAEAISGGKIGNLMGTTVSAMHSDRPDIVEDISRTFAEKVSFQREMAYSLKSTGEDKTLFVKYAYMPPDLVLVITEDITELNKAVEALRNSEHLLRIVSENYPAFLSIILKGEQDLIVDFTTGKEFKKLNLDPESFIGKTLDEVFGDQASIVRENYMRVFMGEEVSFELFINDQNQLYNASPLIDKNGVIDRILVVVENIDERKLFEAQIKQSAATAERDRLAGDLHDAVTQTLFTASVIAESLPQIWDEDEATGKSYLERLPIMLRGALAEMRILLLELRPSNLREQTLGHLFKTLTESVRTYTRATVTLKVDGDHKLPEDVTMSIFRIVQECMNNITKHSEASQINIWLCSDREGVEINISDDGRGFDPESIPTGHLGIGIMRDRAQQIGANLKIESEPGSGSLVILTWTNQAPSISEK